MFIGHVAIGFAAKRAAPRTSLGVLTAAALLPDLLFPLFVLAGFEQVKVEPGNTAVTPLAFVHYPFSHSLLAGVGWALLLALAYWIVTRYRAGAVVAGLAVVSHWILDVVTHRPDVPLYPGASPKVGLGLWNSLPGTVAVEGLLLLAGVWLYVASTRARDRVGILALWTFVALLIALYLASLTGPPPPDVKAFAVADLAALLLLAWVAWFDHHRVPCF